MSSADSFTNGPNSRLPGLTQQQEEELYGINSITVLDTDNTRSDQPTAIQIPLKSHQLALIEYCQQLETCVTNPIIHKEEINNGESIYELSSKMGIIGDVVGSGKTLSVLGLIAHTINKPLNNKDFNMLDTTNSSNFMAKCIERKVPVLKEIDTTLVVVPHPIFKQWEQTIKTNTNLSYMGVNNTKSLKKLEEFILKSILKDQYKSNIQESDSQLYNDSMSSWKGEGIEDLNLLIVSSTFYVRLINIINSKTFKLKRIVFDEADSIKIVGGIIPTRSFAWYVTSTFGSLLKPNGIRLWQNPLNGDHSQYYNYSQGYTQSLRLNGISSSGFIKNEMVTFEYQRANFKKYFIVKNSNDFVQSAFNLEPPKETILKCKLPLALRVLSSNASTAIVAFINAGDIKGAVESLDCNKVSEAGLIDAVTNDLQIKLKNCEIEMEAKSKMTFSSQSVKTDILDKIYKKIVHLNTKITNIQEKLNSSQYCGICFDCDIVCPTITPCCKTKFCFECITKWLTSSCSHSHNHNNVGCPHCRAKIIPNDLIIVDNDAAEAQAASKANDCAGPKKKKELDKNDTLRNLLLSRKQANPNFKLLIFTEYLGTFDNISSILTESDIRYAQVSGTTSTINKKIVDYKSSGDSSIDCLLLNAEFCASGLNLENTTDIVIMHNMSSSKMIQIIGRGQRPGRTGTLNVWKLFYETEIQS